MATQSTTPPPPIPIPVGPRSENLDWVAITIQPADSSTVAPVPAVLPVPSDPLRTATNNLNSLTHQLPPTGGNSERRKTSGRMKTPKTNGKKSPNGETSSHFTSVKCRKCGRIGHIKKHCKLGSKPGHGGTRGTKSESLIAESLKETAAQVAGAQDAALEQDQDAQESAQPSSEEPVPKLPEHSSSLSSSQPDSQGEGLQLDRILARCADPRSRLNKPVDAFQFWALRFGSLYVLSVLIQFSIVGHWAWLCIFSQAPIIFFAFKALWLECKEKRWFYEAYIRACQIYADRIALRQDVPSSFDEGIQFGTELRVDNHSLKDAELRPYLKEVELWRANDKHWILNLCFPEYFTKEPSRLVVSTTLLKHLVSDIDVFYDTKQLLLKSQMQCLRNQRVAISASDVALYGDVYGNTALIASFHNERVNAHKRGILDFLRSPARA